MFQTWSLKIYFLASRGVEQSCRRASSNPSPLTKRLHLSLYSPCFARFQCPPQGQRHCTDGDYKAIKVLLENINLLTLLTTLFQVEFHWYTWCHLLQSELMQSRWWISLLPPFSTTRRRDGRSSAQVKDSAQYTAGKVFNLQYILALELDETYRAFMKDKPIYMTNGHVYLIQS